MRDGLEVWDASWPCDIVYEAAWDDAWAVVTLNHQQSGTVASPGEMRDKGLSSLCCLYHHFSSAFLLQVSLHSILSTFWRNVWCHQQVWMLSEILLLEHILGACGSPSFNHWRIYFHFRSTSGPDSNQFLFRIWFFLSSELQQVTHNLSMMIRVLLLVYFCM